MIDLTMEGLLRSFSSQWAKESQLVGIAVVVGNSTSPEYIINTKANFDSKEAYYAKAYDENLALKANPDIRIVNYTFGNTFDDIQEGLGY